MKIFTHRGNTETQRPTGILKEDHPTPHPILGSHLNELAEFSVRRILVPLDFSECSSKAMLYALPWAAKLQAELVLLHVVQPFVPVPEMGPVDAETLQDADEALAETQRQIGTKAQTRIVLRQGDPAREIVRAARELSVDMIIISTHGRTGVERVLLGSTTERVVRMAKCPVLVVREVERDFVEPTHAA